MDVVQRFTSGDDAAAVAAATPLRAGALGFLLDPELAAVRQLRLGEIELVRGIVFAVRDRNWLTIAPRITRLDVDPRGDACHIAVEAVCRQDPIDFHWSAAIECTPSRLRYHVRGVARSAFLRNRIGLVVLHPAHVAGLPCDLEHADGTRRAGCFPRLVSPQQPFLALRSILHSPAPGVRVTVRMEGEVFETEDQRNWIDGSFKTYGTPLSLPLPVQIEKGSAIEQSVEITVEPAAPPSIAAPARPRDATPAVSLTREGSAPLPPLGVLLDEPMNGEADAVARLGPAHVRIDVRPQRRDAARALAERAAALPAEVAVELALYLGEDAQEIDAALDAVAALRDRAARVLMLCGRRCHPPHALLQEGAARLRDALPRSAVLAGSDANFAELNRSRPAMRGLDGVSWATNPQVHARDALSLIESVEGIAATIETARVIAEGGQTALSPLSLRGRFNPVATDPSAPFDSVDDRQGSPFVAGWTACALREIALARATSATLYELAGGRGVVAADGTPTPTFDLLSGVCRRAGGRVLAARSTAPFLVDALAIEHGGVAHVWMVNHGRDPVEARLELDGTERRHRLPPGATLVQP